MMDVKFCQILKKDYRLKQEDCEEGGNNLSKNRRIMRDVKLRPMLENDYRKIDGYNNTKNY